MPKQPNSKVDPNSSNTVQLTGDPVDRPRLIAQIAVTPSLQAASTIKQWSHAVGDLDITALIRRTTGTGRNCLKGRSEAPGSDAGHPGAYA